MNEEANEVRVLYI